MQQKSLGSKIGVLLINLGTPDQPTVSSVRRYLREFLLDPRVIDLPVFWRYLLVCGVILPFRPCKVVKAYQAIWQDEGSPLRLHTQALAKQVGDLLGEAYQVEGAMRYGNPSIASALKKLAGCQQLVALPLFPQYASAATGSAMAKLFVELAKQWNLPKVTVIDQFYQQPAFIDPLVEKIKPALSHPDSFLLLSYHGLPERHLVKSHCKITCQNGVPCPAIDSRNAFCYRAQCYATSKQLIAKLGLSADCHMTTFQSRLGKLPWIKPYTDEMLPKLYERGIRKLVVACPAFVADCLETLEEIGMQAKEQWLALGGTDFTLVPCLNSDPAWVQGVAALVRQA